MGQRSDRPRDRLAVAAAPLRPARSPYYLQTPDGSSEPAPGWYMIPAGAEHPTYLGANLFAAHLTLTRLIDLKQRATAA